MGIYILTGLSFLLIAGLGVLYLSSILGQLSLAIFGFFVAALSFIIIIVILIKERIEERRDEDDFSKY